MSNIQGNSASAAERSYAEESADLKGEALIFKERRYTPPSSLLCKNSCIELWSSIVDIIQ